MTVLTTVRHPSFWPKGIECPTDSLKTILSYTTFWPLKDPDMVTLLLSCFGDRGWFQRERDGGFLRSKESATMEVEWNINEVKKWIGRITNKIFSLLISSPKHHSLLPHCSSSWGDLDHSSLFLFLFLPVSSWFLSNIHLLLLRIAHLCLEYNQGYCCRWSTATSCCLSLGRRERSLLQQDLGTN